MTDPVGAPVLVAFRIAVGGSFGAMVALFALLVASASWVDGPDPAAEEVWLLAGFVVGASRAAIEQLWGAGRPAVALAVVVSALAAPGLVASADPGACGREPCGSGQVLVLVGVIAVGSALLSFGVHRVLQVPYGAGRARRPSDAVAVLVIVGAVSLLVMQRLRVGPVLEPPVLPAVALSASFVAVVAEQVTRPGRRCPPVVGVGLTVAWTASALWLWSAAA